MYLVFDLETQNHVFHRRTASPFDQRNWIIAKGWKKQGDISCSYTHHPEYTRDVALHIPEDVNVLVGFNIKFDLLWLWETKELQAFFKRGGTVWCCQYAEYLLRAQHEKFHMVDLNTVSKLCGGTQKIDLVKDMWNAGKLTSEIPSDLLIDYLVGTEASGRNDGDISNTEIVYLNQVKRAEKFKMTTAIQQRMEGLLATTMMEWNGLKIDTKEAKTRLQELSTEFHALESTLNTFIPKFPNGALASNSSSPLEFSWSSKHHVSALIFGGAIKYRLREPLCIDGVIQYTKIKESWPLYNGEPVHPDADMQVPQDVYLSGKKKGDLKFKIVEVHGEMRTHLKELVFEFPGYIRREIVLEGKHPKGGWEAECAVDALGIPLMRTGGDCLEILGNFEVPFCKVLSRFAALNKEIGTYYIRYDKDGKPSGMLTCVEEDTDTIHHKLNHSSTVTTRLSSGDPNLQNLPRGDKSNVKKMFVSRFGNDGLMIEADYSQLEVVGLAMLSQDEQLTKDLLSGIDFHCKRVSLKHSIDYDDAVIWCKDESHPEYKHWKSERTKCKIFSFQSQYGAGASTIASETGMSVEEVKELMEVENRTYPGIKKFTDGVARAIERSAKPFQDPVRGFRTFRRGYWQAPTGTLYTWRSYDAPAFLQKTGVKDTFSPPEIKNYPVQGTSGEFVQCILGKLFREFIRTGNYGNRAYLVNTVHDCVWIDTHKDVTERVAPRLKEIMESIPEVFSSVYGIEMAVKFPVSVETGPNMFDLTHWS